MPQPQTGLTDASVLLGRDTRTGVETTPEAIRDALTPWGTVCACVTILEALLYDPVSGNATALALARREAGRRGRYLLSTIKYQVQTEAFAISRRIPGCDSRQPC